MIIIGVDPHKSSHTATAVDPATGQPVASITVPASTVGYRRLWRWAARFDQRRWAIENARGLGRHLAQWLVHRNEHVVDVPATATTRVRELSRGGRRKNDTIDASAAACVAALHGDATVVAVEDHTDVFAVLEERRANLAAQRVRLVNQLHAQLRDLVAGGAPTDLPQPPRRRCCAACARPPPPIRLAATSPATCARSTSGSPRSPRR